MSIKIQKIIRFIPIVNLLTVVFWIRLVVKQNQAVNRIFKPMIKVFVSVIVILIPRIIIAKTVDSYLINMIALYISTYLVDVVMAFIFVDDQVKLLEQKGENKED